MFLTVNNLNRLYDPFGDRLSVVFRLGEAFGIEKKYIICSTLFRIAEKIITEQAQIVITAVERQNLHRKMSVEPDSQQSQILHNTIKKRRLLSSHFYIVAGLDPPPMLRTFLRRGSVRAN